MLRSLVPATRLCLAPRSLCRRPMASASPLAARGANAAKLVVTQPPPGVLLTLAPYHGAHELALALRAHHWCKALHTLWFSALTRVAVPRFIDNAIQAAR